MALVTLYLQRRDQRRVALREVETYKSTERAETKIFPA